MPLDRAALQAALAPLKAKYVVHLREVRQEIADFYAACERSAVTQEQREAMRQRAHKLAGTGTTYGFSGISEAGRTLENALDKALMADALSTLAQALLDACDEALATPDAVPAEPVKTAAPEPTKSVEIAKKPLLLAADDDANIRTMVSQLFSNDAEVITASNGKEALRLIEERKPDLVLLDDIMPEMTGLKLLEILRGRPDLAGIPVVMLTASNREKDVMRGLMDGAVDYIGKPFDPSQLQKVIAARLKRQKTTLLIADDDAAVRELLAHKFQALGVRIWMAEDGEQALELAQKHRPQLAILDRMMPGLDGMAVLQKLREHNDTKDIPVLFLTAKHQEQNVLEGFKLGAADYIAKPFSPDEVVARCLRLLQQKGGTL